MLPKTYFHRSYIYDSHLVRKPGYKMPSDKFMINRTNQLHKEWSKHEKAVMREIEKVTGLKWTESFIYFYVTAGTVPFSDPLTLNMNNSQNQLFDILVHELIHRIWVGPGNWDKIEKRWNGLMKKYKSEGSESLRAHIMVHAIHKAIFLKLFGIKALQREIKWSQKYPEYKRAWEIVERDGYENIIKMLNPKYKK
jgi:hypothetical protein